MLQIDLPAKPSYPAALPSFDFRHGAFDEAQKRLWGTPIALSAGGQTFQGSAAVEALAPNRVGSVRLSFERIAFETFAEALVSVWGPVHLGSKKQLAWFDDAATPSFRALATQSKQDSLLYFGPVQPFAAFFDRLSGAMRGEPVLPLIGMTRADVESKFGAQQFTRELNDARDTIHWAPLANGLGETVAIPVYDRQGRVGLVRFHGRADAVDSKKAVAKAVEDFCKTAGISLAPKQTVGTTVLDGNIELQLGYGGTPTTMGLTASFQKR